MKRAAVFAAILCLASGCPGKTPPSRTEAKRIVSLLPSFTETLLLIGGRDRLVGVTSFSPAGTDGIRKLGGLVDPDLEAIFSLEPDLVIGMKSHSTAHVERKLQASGLVTLFLPNESLADAMGAITAIGERTGMEREAEALRRQIEQDLTEIQERVKGAGRVKTAVAVQLDPLILAGKGSFLDELVRLAGGENIASDSKTPHPLFSEESLVVRAPEVIIDVSEAYEGGVSPEAVIRKWDRLPSTPAREAGRIHPLGPEVPINPGPRVALLLKFIAEKIHPDRFR